MRKFLYLITCFTFSSKNLTAFKFLKNMEETEFTILNLKIEIDIVNLNMAQIHQHL